MSTHDPSTQEFVTASENKTGQEEDDRALSFATSHGNGILVDHEDGDVVLNKKLLLVDTAINEIGWTNYHLKLFCLTGFGYAVDSMAASIQSVIARQAYRGFGSKGYPTALTVAIYTGGFVGAVAFGLMSDSIGRRFAFNLALFFVSIATLISGAMPSWPSLAFFVSLIGMGAAGGIVMDTTIFLEFLPLKHRWLLTMMGIWFGIGQIVIGLFSWGFLAPTRFNCTTSCTYDNNMGWRYLSYTVGGLIMVLSILRVTVINLQETPKYLLVSGRDADLIKTLDYVADRYHRSHSLTLEQLQACGEVQSAHAKKKRSVGELLFHLRGLFTTRKLALSTSMIWLSWMVTGIAGPLFFIFLPTYLLNRGADFSESVSDSWRDYVLSNIGAVFGPVFASYFRRIPGIGHRRSMAIGAALSMAFLFAYTSVRNVPQNLGLSCAISFSLFWYTGALFAYTPEVMPTAHRATGYGIGYGLNRLMGIVCAIIGASVDLTSSVPIYICASLFGLLIVLSVLLPFEPTRHIRK